MSFGDGLFSLCDGLRMGRESGLSEPPACFYRVSCGNRRSRCAESVIGGVSR